MIKQVKYYIKKNNGEYFEVWPQNRVEITNAPYQNEYFYRNGFSGELTFRNYEKVNYKTVSNQKLFDTLLSITKPRDLDRFKDKFNIKLDFNNGEFIVYGYFGILDYNVNNNANGKIITIKPTVKDEYTTLFRNWDNKVDVFGSTTTNKLVNGSFETWSSETQPYGWTLNNNVPIEKYYYLSSNKVKMRGYRDDIIADSLNMSFSQQISGIKKGTPVFVDFGFILSNGNLEPEKVGSITMIDPKTRFSREMSINLILDNGDIYSLGQDLKWGLNTSSRYTYCSNKLPYTNDELSSITSLYKLSIATEPTPSDGVIEIKFYAGSSNSFIFYMYSTPITIRQSIYTIIDNVIIRANTNILKKITANILSNYLQITSFYTTNNSDPICSCFPVVRYYDDNGIEMYYDDTTNAPTSNLLSHEDFAPHDEAGYGRSTEGLKLGDWVDIFAKNDGSVKYNQSFYNCELAEIVVYQTESVYMGWFKKDHRYIYATAKFARDYATTDGTVYTKQDYEDGKCDFKDIGTEIPPAKDAGWVETKYKDSKGRTEWCRRPFNSENNEWETATIVTNGGDKGSIGKLKGHNIEKILTLKRKYLTTIGNTTGSEYEFTTCIDLRELIKTVFNGTHSEFSGKTVVSQFFWNDFPNELPTFDSTNNYVTGRKNELNNIACLHTFDVKTIGSTEELTEDDLSDSRLQLSLKEILTSFENRFKILNNSSLMWFIDLNGDLRIEHQSYFYMTGISTASERPDDTFPNRPTLKYYDEYKFLQELLPSKITITQGNAGYSDFVDNVVKFDEIVSGSREEELKNEITIDKFTTDLKYCLENKSNLDNGVILINFEQSGSNLVVSYGKIQLDNTSFINGNLSISSILKNYCRYEGTFTEGYINNDPAIFSETPYNKEGKELTLLGIVTQNFIRTKIGTGKVISRKFNFDIGKLTTTVTLRYSSRVFIDGGNGKILDLGFYI